MPVVVRVPDRIPGVGQLVGDTEGARRYSNL